MNRRCWFNSFAAWLLLTLGLAGAAHAAGSINGAWTLVGNGYLAMVQDSVSGSVVVVLILPPDCLLKIFFISVFITM